MGPGRQGPETGRDEPQGSGRGGGRDLCRVLTAGVPLGLIPGTLGLPCAQHSSYASQTKTTGKGARCWHWEGLKCCSARQGLQRQNAALKERRSRASRQEVAQQGAQAGQGHQLHHTGVKTLLSCQGSLESAKPGVRAGGDGRGPALGTSP